MDELLGLEDDFDDFKMEKEEDGAAVSRKEFEALAKAHSDLQSEVKSLRRMMKEALPLSSMDEEEARSKEEVVVPASWEQLPGVGEEPVEMNGIGIEMSETMMNPLCSEEKSKKSSDNKQVSEGEPEEQDLDESENCWEEFEHSYALEGSMWDASILLNTEPVGPAATVWGVLLITMNVIAQLVFCAVVMEQLTIPTITNTSIDSLRNWRRNIAHDYKYMDTLSGQSLAARVCAGDAGLAFSNGQADLYSVISTYLTPNNVFLFKNGPLMCTLALLMWFMAVVQDVGSTISFLVGVSRLPKGDATVIETNEEGKFALTTVSPGRLLCVYLLMSVRFFVSGSLFYSGARYLVNTLSLGDLLINCVALTFILAVDELIYDCMAPICIKNVVDKSEELELPPVKAWKGLSMHAVGHGLSVLILMAVTLIVYLWPQDEKLLYAIDAICGGNTDFGYAVDAAGFPAWASSPPVPGSSSSGRPWRQASQEQQTNMPSVGVLLDKGVLRNLTCDNVTCWNQAGSTALSDNDCCWVSDAKVPFIKGSPFSLQTYSSDVVATANLFKINPYCLDQFDNKDYRYNQWLSFTGASNNDATKCDANMGCPDRFKPFCRDTTCVAPTCKQDVKPFCEKSTLVGTRARMFCPSLCGCGDPNSTNILATGCAPACTTNYFYTTALDTMPCDDMWSWESVGNTGVEAATSRRRFWRTAKYAADIAALASMVSSSHRSSIMVATDKMNQMGCDAVNYMNWYYGVQLCDFGWNRGLPFKGLKVICPIACGCENSYFPYPRPAGCPGTCTRRRRNYRI